MAAKRVYKIYCLVVAELSLCMVLPFRITEYSSLRFHKKKVKVFSESMRNHAESYCKCRMGLKSVLMPFDLLRHHVQFLEFIYHISCSWTLVAQI